MKKVISFSVWKVRIPTREANQTGVDGDANINTNSFRWETEFLPISKAAATWAMER
jgi:hypothetical protein